MKKFKIDISFLLLIIACVFLNNLMLLFNYFIALILHELAHLYVATKHGYKLKQFRLCAFGVSAQLDEEIENQDAFAINVAGPLMNLMLCVFCLAIGFISPKLYSFLHTFCFSNIVLALFNILPVYPLDGGKIFAGIIRDEKKFNIVNSTIKISFSLLFFCLFIVSGLIKFNWFYLLVALFFISCNGKKKPTFSLFKHRIHRRTDKIELIRVDETITLFELLKLIKTNKYTIFFCSTLEQKYIDEDAIINLSLKHPLTKSLNRVYN